MSSIKRKIKRKKKKEAEKDLKEKMGLFDKMPNECTMCDRPFNKKDREQVNSWRVAVREREEKVKWKKHMAFRCKKCKGFCFCLLTKIYMGHDGCKNRR